MSYLIYDGACPVCSRYAEFAVLKRRNPDIELVNARENPNHPAVRKAIAAGHVIDEGMVFVDGETLLYGADVLSEMSNHLLARNYTLLKIGRKILLKLLRKSRLGF